MVAQPTNRTHPFTAVLQALRCLPHNPDKAPNTLRIIILFLCSHQILFVGGLIYARAQFFHPIAKRILAPANQSGPSARIFPCLRPLTELPSPVRVQVADADLSCQLTNAAINLSRVLCKYSHLGHTDSPPCPSLPKGIPELNIRFLTVDFFGHLIDIE